jgi:hypothetical protein
MSGSLNPVVDPGERQRPQSGGDIHPDAEREDFRRVHAEGSPGIHPAEDEDGGQPLDVEQPSDQEADDVPITAQGAERVAQLAKCVARGAAERLAGARRGCEKMGLAPSGNGENSGKSAVAKVPVPIFSQPRRVRRQPEKRQAE